jgi:hypothetical protein
MGVMLRSAICSDEDLPQAFDPKLAWVSTVMVIVEAPVQCASADIERTSDFGEVEMW